MIPYFVTVLGGNLLMEVLGDAIAQVSISQASQIWDRFKLGQQELQTALHLSYEKTCSSMEIMLAAPETWRDFFRDLLKSQGEKEFAQAFGERFLVPFLRQHGGLLRGRTADFLHLSRLSCRILKELGPRFGALTLHATGRDLTDPASPTPDSASTFHLLKAILFQGSDLAQAPLLQEARGQAGETILTFLKREGGKRITETFKPFQVLEELFYELLGDQDLFVSGLTYFLLQQIKTDPRLAVVLQHLEELAGQVRGEQDARSRRQEHTVLLQRLEELQHEMQDIQAKILVRQERDLPIQALQADLDALSTMLIPLQEQHENVALLVSRTQAWEQFQHQLAAQNVVFERSFGVLGDRLNLLAERLAGQDTKLDSLGLSMDSLHQEVQHVARDTADLKTSLGELLSIKAWDRISQRYEILETVGSGQFGLVLRVANRQTGEERALKVLRADTAGESDVRKRFMNEAYTAYELSHPNIVKVYDVDPIGGYFEMEYLPGKTLRQTIREMPHGIPEALVVHLTEQLSDALAYLHRDHHIAHRDLKPENILLVPDAGGKLVLTDFGAITHLDVVKETFGVGLAGTAQYMSPEQFEGARSPQIDIYALGIILYEMICGHPPFQGPNVIEIREQHRTMPPQPPSLCKSDVPGYLEAVILKCLAKDPKQRFSSVGELREALQSPKGESERERHEREGHEREFTTTLKLVLLRGEPTDLEREILAERARDLGIESQRASELEVLVGNMDEIKQQQAANIRRERDQRLQDFRTLVRRLWRKGYLEDEDRREIEEERLALRLETQEAEILEREVLADPKVRDRINLLAEAGATGTEPPGWRSPDNSASGQELPGFDTARRSSNGAGAGSGKRPAAGEALGGKQQPLLFPGYEALDLRKCHRLTSTRVLGAGRLLKAVAAAENPVLVTASTMQLSVYDAVKLNRILVKPLATQILSLAVTADGSLCAIGDKEGDIRLLRIPSGEEAGVLKRSASDASCLFFSRYGNILVSGSWDGTIILWDVTARKQLARFETDGLAVCDVTLPSHTAFVVAGCLDSVVRVIDRTTAKEIRTFKGHSMAVNSVRLSPNDRILVSGSADRSIMVWDIETNERILELRGHTAGVIGAVMLADGRTLVSAGSDGTARVWDAYAGEQILRFTAHPQALLGLQANGKGQEVISAGSEGAVRFWDAETGKERACLADHLPQLRCMELLAGKSLLIAGGMDGILRVWRMPNLDLQIQIRLDAPIHSLAVSEATALIAAGTANGTIHLIDPETGREKAKLANHYSPLHALAFSEDGKSLLSAGDERGIRLWNPTSGRVRLKLARNLDRFQALLISPDGKQAWSGTHDGILSHWDLETGEELQHLVETRAPITAMAWGTGRKSIVVGAADGSIRVKGVATGKELLRLQDHSGLVATLVVVSLESGPMLISAGMDRIIRLWNLTTGAGIGRLNGHGDLVSGVAFAPGTHQILSSSWDGTIRLWSLGKNGH